MLKKVFLNEYMIFIKYFYTLTKWLEKKKAFGLLGDQFCLPVRLVGDCIANQVRPFLSFLGTDQSVQCLVESSNGNNTQLLHKFLAKHSPRKKKIENEM